MINYDDYAPGEGPNDPPPGYRYDQDVHRSSQASGVKMSAYQVDEIRKRVAYAELSRRARLFEETPEGWREPAALRAVSWWVRKRSATARAREAATVTDP